MKRTACAIIMIFVSLLILSSCSEKSGSVYLIDVSDGLSDGAVNIKVDEKIAARFSTDEFTDGSAPASARITAGGVTYTGTYGYSDRGLMSALTRDHYKDDDGNTFAIVRDSGKLGDFYRFLAYDETLPVACSIEQGKDIALSFLGEIVDADNYTLLSTWTEDDFEHSNVLGYSYEFVRLIDDIPTNDVAYIHVDSRHAAVCRYISYSVGEFAGVTLPEDFSLERSMDAVETKAGEMWSAAAASDGAASSAPDFEVLRDTCCLVRTEKGKLALAADVNVARKDANLKDRVTMLMIID